MARVSRRAEYAALIGDMVRSRDVEDRRRLHELVRLALDEVNAELPSVQPLSPTVGDEFQAVYGDLPSAMHATLLLRLSLTSVAEVRFGIGWGPLDVFEEDKLPFEQDGPAWWAARDAIERVALNMRQKEGPRGLRTACLVSDAAVDAEELPTGSSRAILNGFLMCRDEIVAGMDERDARITLALLRNTRQRTIAEEENISQSAVAQRISRSGAYALVQAHDSLLKEAEWNSSESG
jgi:SatD family (SatD)